MSTTIIPFSNSQNFPNQIPSMTYVMIIALGIIFLPTFSGEITYIEIEVGDQNENIALDSITNIRSVLQGLVIY